LWLRLEFVSNRRGFLGAKGDFLPSTSQNKSSSKKSASLFNHLGYMVRLSFSWQHFVRQCFREKYYGIPKIFFNVPGIYPAAH
jgi:hypothetical protein